MLRVINEIIGYTLLALDGEIGRCHDFLFDDRSSVVRYMVAKTSKWLPGCKVLVSPQWLESIHWVNEKVYIDLSTDAIRNSPEFDPSQPVNRLYETELYDYYGRPRYWKP